MAPDTHPDDTHFRQTDRRRPQAPASKSQRLAMRLQGARLAAASFTRRAHVPARSWRSGVGIAAFTASAPVLLAPAFSRSIAADTLMLLQLAGHPLLTAAGVLALAVALTAAVATHRWRTALLAGVLVWAGVLLLPLLMAISDSAQPYLLDISMVSIVVAAICALAAQYRAEVDRSAQPSGDAAAGYHRLVCE